VTNTSNLLNDSIFEYEHIFWFKSRIVMTVGIQGDDR